MDLAKPPDPDPGPAPDDTARARADAALQAAVGRGRLGLAEYEQRSERVWSARTVGELELLTADVPPSEHPVPARPARARDHTVAVFSSATSRGSAGGAVAATAVFGAAELDLRRTDLPRVVDVRAVAVFGETTVLVPRGVVVHTRGPSLFGSRSVRVAAAEPGAPVVTVHGGSVFGSVTVGHGDDQVAPSTAVEGRGRRRHGSPWHRVAAVVAIAAAGYGLTQVATADSRSVFGSGTLRVGGQDSVDVGVLFGSEKVVVPDDAYAVLTGGTVFGSVRCQEACTPNVERTRAVTVDAGGAFGSVEVLTTTEADQDGGS